ncbi:hypothetical protein ABIB51_004594 [Arthrobacter sp. UYCu712]
MVWSLTLLRNSCWSPSPSRQMPMARRASFSHRQCDQRSPIWSNMSSGLSATYAAMCYRIAYVREGSASLELCVAQVLVDNLPADPVVTDRNGLRNTAAGTLEQLGRTFRCEDLFPPFLGAALLGQGDTFPLAFDYEGAVEFATTFQPRSERCSGMDLPIPRAPPVTSTVRSRPHPHSSPNDQMGNPCNPTLRPRCVLTPE